MNKNTLSREVRDVYERTVNDLIVYRARFTLPAGIVLFLAFNYIDHLVYPAHAHLFLKIRLLAALWLAILMGLSFIEKIRSHYLNWALSSIVLITASIIFMIYTADGSKSHYYEGINLTFWGLICMNSFSTKHNILVGTFILILYNLAVFLNPYWDWTSYCFANSFMISTLFLICLMTKLYGSQHLNGFLANEKLQRSEKNLAETNVKLAGLYRTADELSKIDDLTKIYNRRYFMEILESKLEESKQSGKFFYLVLFDIDLFKQINDRYGHSAGDRVLYAVVDVVKKNIRTNGFLGRYGGDEFVFIIDQADKAVFLSRIETIRSAVKDIRLDYGSQELTVSVSIGAVKVDPAKYNDIQKIIELADKALLDVKKEERGTIHLLE